MQDLRAAIRALTRKPGFALLAIGTLALGIGGNAAIFSMIDRVLLRPLPYPRADRLVVPWEFSAEVQQKAGFETLPVSPADATDFRTRNTTFAGLAWVRSERFNLTGAGDPERLTGVRVSTDFFDVLGVPPAIGRTFTREDVGGSRGVLLSDRLWRQRFGADAAVLGRVVSLNSAPAVVLGVLPPWFRFPAEGDLPSALGFSGDVDIWSADVLSPAQQAFRGGKSFALIGRLKEGVDVGGAAADLNRIAADIARESPQSNAGWTVRIKPLREQLVRDVRTALIVLLVAVGFVLLIACANVANLMLVRAAGRRREWCVRLALGAGRGQLVRQMLLESLVLAVAAGVAGLAVAWAGLHVMLALTPVKVSALANASLDWRVAGFTLAVSLMTGILFGIIPALQVSRADLNEGLRDGGRGTAGSRRAHRTRNLLVVAEVALAMVLLVGAVLLLQTFVRLLNVDAGFRPGGVLTVEVSLPRTVYPPPAAADFFDRVVARLTPVPGVQHVAVTSGVPLSGLENLRQVTIEGQPRPDPGQEVIADYRVVTRDYFAVMGIPQLAGEPLPATVIGNPAPAVLVNATMAATMWPGQEAVGRRIKLTSYDQNAPWHVVVGVVGDTRQTGLDSGLRPQVYVEQRDDPGQQMIVVVKTAADPLGLAPVARAAVLETDRNQPVGRIRPMTDVLADSVSSRRFTMFLVGAFAVLAFGLSLVGLYAVVSHSVAERRQEMGVRLALGASRGSLLRLVLSEGLALTGAGILLGVAAALIGTRYMVALLYGVAPSDALTLVVVSVLVIGAAAAGCLVPARRAMRVDPVSVLRAE